MGPRDERREEGRGEGSGIKEEGEGRGMVGRRIDGEEEERGRTCPRMIRTIVMFVWFLLMGPTSHLLQWEHFRVQHIKGQHCLQTIKPIFLHGHCVLGHLVH